jgi:hypothetical protein
MAKTNPYSEFIIDQASDTLVPNPLFIAWEQGHAVGRVSLLPAPNVNKRLAEENENLRTALVKAQARAHALEETRPVDGKVPGRLYIELVRRDGKLRLELVKYERGIPT